MHASRVSCFKSVHGLDDDGDERGDHELRDPIAGCDLERSVRIQIDQRHFDRAAVAGIDDAGSIQHRDAVLGSEATARTDQTGGAGRKGDGEPGIHQCALSGFESMRRRGAKVQTRITVVRAGGKQVSTLCCDGKSCW